MTHPLPGRRLSRAAIGVLAAAAMTGLASMPAVAFAAEPDLGVGPIAPITGAHPGSGVDLPFSVLNKGTEDVDKVWVSYSVTSGLAAADKYGNCEYHTEPSYDEAPEQSVAECAFDQTLKPGVVYVPDKPVGLKAQANALHDEVNVGIGTTEPGESDGGGSEPVPGTGAPLKLVEKGEATDEDRANHDKLYSIGEVTTENTADFSLTGAELDGKVGDKVTASVKFTNKGPAWVYRGLDQSATTVDIRIPEGTSVVKAHDYCDAVSKTHYTCGTSQAWVNKDGGETYPFVLRIDKVVDGAKGKVSFTGADRSFDKNPDNDTADIVVNAGAGDTTGGSSTGGSSTGGSSTGGSSTGGSSTGGSSTDGSTTGGSSTGTTTGGSSTGGTAAQSATGGDLANTGSDSTVPMVGASVAALIAGGGIFYAVRRRAAGSN